jgi:tRNA (mo5U34)-methyltransferase
MSIHRHAAAIFATDGLSGLLRRGARKVFRALTGRQHPDTIRLEAERQRSAEQLAQQQAQQLAETIRLEAERQRSAEQLAQLAQQQAQQLARDAEEMDRHRAEYAVQGERFRAEVRRRGFGGLDGFYWYHTVDLGDGLVTPGDYDYRDRLADYPFPADMSGMTVLDVGSATGFFAFEFERRGAEVTSVELPSVADWDILRSDRDWLMNGLMAYHSKTSLPEMDHAHMHGPFGFCHRMRNSRVRRCLSRIYDLTPEKLGRDQFDFIFLGDVLGHLFSPLAALNALAPLCRKEMVVSYSLSDMPGVALGYMGGADRQGDARYWFNATWEALQQMLLRVGFKKAERVGSSDVIARRAWQRMRRDLIRAVK